jgi:hypothetical protein
MSLTFHWVLRVVSLAIIILLSVRCSPQSTKADYPIIILVSPAKPIEIKDRNVPSLFPISDVAIEEHPRPLSPPQQ